MQEVDLENILARYPELVEPHLTLVARQFALNGKRIDLLFRDGGGCKLVVEVKVGTLCRADVGQLSEYCHYLFKLDGLRPRGMLVGTWVSDEIRGAAGFNGFGCRILLFDDLEKFASERGDVDMLETVRGRGASRERAPTPGEPRGRARTGAEAASLSPSSRAPFGDLPAKPSIA